MLIPCATPTCSELIPGWMADHVRTLCGEARCLTCMPEPQPDPLAVVPGIVDLRGRFAARVAMARVVVSDRHPQRRVRP